MTNSNPLHCPFCGGKNARTRGSFRWKHIRCDDCQATGPQIRLKSPEESKTEAEASALAIAAWNNRTGDITGQPKTQECWNLFGCNEGAGTHADACPASEVGWLE